jgi:HTH-type transcriptional regulator / antitoxin HigA
MDVQPIKTKRDYLRVLKEIGRLMDAKRGTSEGDRLDILVTLVEAWEARHYPPDSPIPSMQSNITWNKRGLSHGILYVSSAVEIACPKCSIANVR